MSKPKIILITGGDMNNIDKGIIPASIGLLLKANGYTITVIKMDPCFNQNSIYLNPTKYGENYCLVDGELASINFGYYERILGQIFTKINYITRGKVGNYANIQNETKHIFDKIRSVNFIDATVKLIKNVFDKPIDGKFPDICIIELGGGVNGELSDKKFLQALSSEFKYKTEFLHVHISKLVGGKLGFLETSVQNLRNNKWKPDIIICRSTTPFSDVYKKHISHFAELNIDMVINLPDVPNVKWVPIKLQEQNIYNLIANELQLKKIGPNFETKMNELKDEIKKAESYKTVVKIALVAKYQSEGNEICKDSYESMVQQLNIAAEKSCFCKVEINFIRAQDFEDEPSKDIQNTAWALLKEAQGIIIPGGYGDEAFKGFFKACKYARINKKPFLSICCGFQCAVAEFAQNVCGINYGESNEKKFEKILIKMLENGAPRMGQHTVTFLTKNSKLFELYGKKNFIKERNWNQYEINPSYISLLASRGLRFVGIGFNENEDGVISKPLQTLMGFARIHDKNDEEGYIKTIEKLCKYSHKTDTALRMQAFELKDHPYYVGIQYHAKFGLRPSSPSPPFVGLIKAALREKELIKDKNDVKMNASNYVENVRERKPRFFVFFIKCKELVKDGILRIESFENYLKRKLCNFNGIEVEADKYKVTITSNGKFSKTFLKVLARKYLKKKYLHNYIDVITVEKFELFDYKN